MSSLLEDDTRYVKLWLLLVKGGTYVFKKHTQKILDNDKSTIVICLEPHRDKLSEKKKIYPKLWELLCSNSGQPKDIDVLDISAYAYVLLNIFDKKLDAKEKTAILELRDKRNKLIHRGVNSLPEKDFHIEWNQLMIVLCKLSYTLSSDDEDYVNKLIVDICAIQDIHKATYELKSFEKLDDFVKDVLAKKECIQDRRLDELHQRLCELEKIIESRQLEFSARITVSSSTQTACDAAHHQLFDAAKCCLTGGHVNQEEDKVFTACNNMFTDMSKDGANIKKVEEGSVLITFSCSTFTSLKSAILYLTKTVYIQRLQELERALSQSVGCCVKLNVNIILESLISTLDKEEHCTSDKSVILTVSCISWKGVRSVYNNLVNGSSTNTVHSVAETLSTSVGQRIELHRSIDIDKLENEISLLERLHGYHDVQLSSSDGQSEIKETQSDLKDGQFEIKETQSGLKDDLCEIKETQWDMKDGQFEIKHTQSDSKDDQSEIKHSQSELKDGQSEIKQTRSESKDGQSEIKQTQSEFKDGQSEKNYTRFELKDGHSEIKQKLYEIEDALKTRRWLHNSERPFIDVSDIQKILIDAYQSDICSSLPLCPLLDNITEDTLRIYQMPTMYVVNYHNVEKQQTDKSSDNLKEVKTCSDLFHVEDEDCKNIYLTGNAGVGKTSFCKFLSLLWCKSKLGKKLEKVDMQEYIDYLARFEFVFYVNLRGTLLTDLKAIIVTQLFYSENKDKSNRMYGIVEEILGNHDSLVIMDGLDEWTPVHTDCTHKRRYELPVRPISLKCVYLTTCRPYKIENVRLSRLDIDHQVQMTGLGYKEIRAHISNLIRLINFKFDENKSQEEFMMAVEEVNILDMLHIPMTTSHLVFLWFDRPLTSMSKSLIYGNIVDMLFKLAHKKGIVIQQSKPSKLQLPDRLSELKHFEDHFSQIEQLCLLSFKLFFEHDTDITSLVFTRDQLASESYCLSEEETNFFCTIGILSKNKVKRKFGKQEHKLSFLHKSYLEFFAAIYLSTLDTSNVLGLFSQCRTINDVLKYENFLIFYAGLSVENVGSLMTRMYSLISKDLDLTRVLSIFSTDDDAIDKRDQIFSLQDLILKCNIEGSYRIGNSLPLEDFIFNSETITDTKSKYLRKLILLNSNNVGLLRSDTGEYFKEFDPITSLKGLCIYEYDNKYKGEFNELIKQNKSSLQIINIRGKLDTRLSLPLEDLHYLTSLSLRAITMSHEDIQYLTQFLSNNRQLKHVRLENVRCTEHDWISYDVCGSFELLQCNKIVYLNIDDTNIVLNNINTSSLEFIKVRSYSKSIARSYIDIVNSIQNALELKHLYIHGRDMLDDYLVDTLMTNVQYLSNIESIELSGIAIRDNVSFLLHPSVKQVSIILSAVNMTARWFQTFIESVIYKHCCIKLELASCIIRQDYGDTKGDMSREESVDYIHDYIKSISAIQIVEYDSSTMPHNIEFVINDYQ